MKNRTRSVLVAIVTMLGLPVVGASPASAASPSIESTAAIEAPARPPALEADCCNITVPSNYVYNLNHPRRTLHDYCTKSPDQWLYANFRGPCARHDMCFENGTYSRYTCNNIFYGHLRQQCSYTYAWWNPLRGQCYDTAAVYYAAVTLNTLWPW